MFFWNSLSQNDICAISVVISLCYTLQVKVNRTAMIGYRDAQKGRNDDIQGIEEKSGSKAHPCNHNYRDF